MNKVRSRSLYFARIARVITITMLIVTLLTSSTAAASPKRRPELGIATGGSLLNMPPDVLRRRLLDMKRLGATWIRVDFSWAVIQPKDADHYDFRFHDRVVVAAEEQGLKIMGMLAYTPEWARSERCKARLGSSERDLQKCIPRNTQEFVNFAVKTAERYRLHSIHAWEIWNEPNLVGYWKDVNARGAFEINPVTYARFATRTAHAIHTVDRVTVLTGGMAPMFEPSPSRGMRQSDFLRGMLPYLEKGGIAAIGIHPYTWPATPRHKADWNAFYTVDDGKPDHNLHAIVNAAGRPDLVLWGTEYGASTVGLRPPRDAHSARNRPDHVDAKTQAQIIKEGVEDWYKKRGVGPFFVYADSDRYLPRHKNEGGYGLRRKDGSPKPAYDALRDAFRTAQARQ